MHHLEGNNNTHSTVGSKIMESKASSSYVKEIRHRVSQQNQMNSVAHIESQNKSIFPRMDVTEASSVIPPRLTCPRLTCETKGFKNPWRTLRNVTRLVGEYSLPQHRRRHNLPSKFNLAKSFIPEAEREASNVRYTEDVIDILTKDLGWCTLADIKYGKNIYCPLHENPKTSKTPSAVLYLSTHTFKCFSSRCRISTRISTKQLLNLLVSR